MRLQHTTIITLGQITFAYQSFYESLASHTYALSTITNIVTAGLTEISLLMVSTKKAKRRAPLANK
jgi:hypothetical protein